MFGVGLSATVARILKLIFYEQPARPSMPKKIPGQIAVDCKSVHLVRTLHVMDVSLELPYK